nr:transglutaminase domain-containing protein [uncultured Butyrivibrio sp.]
MNRPNTKKKVSMILSTLLICLSLSGCQYSSVDEYLELLGMKEASYEEELTPDKVEISQFPEEIPHMSSEESSKETSSATKEEAQTLPEEKADDEVYEASYHQLTESELNDEMNAARAAIGLTSDNIDRLKKEQEGNYAFDRLTESGKTLYVEILSIIENQAENVLVSSTNEEAIDLVYDYVTIDHPELFYIDGYKYTNYTVDDVVTKVGFSGNYLYSKDEIEERQTKINNAVNACLAGAPSSTDDYFAIKYVYEYIIKNTEYDVEAEDNQNICSVFINGSSVCNGYAKAAQYLLNKMGIKCTLVIGTVNTKSAKNERHAWNIVQCNDAFYYFDVTWGDSSYQVGYGGSADSTRIPEVNYDYLNVTTAELCKNHTISDIIKMPDCSSLKDNYYVREDEYFTTAELSLIAELFDRRYQDGSDCVVIKCADDSIYEALFEELITNRKVFSYLRAQTASVAYTTYEDTNTIIFWI